MKSMTGYARDEFNTGPLNLKLEIKSYNSKNLEIFIKLPDCLDYLEMKLKSFISGYIVRGKVLFNLSDENCGEKDIIVDAARLNDAISILTSIKSAIGSQREITLSDVLKMRFIFKETYRTIDENSLDEIFWPKITEIMEVFEQSRRREAENLETDIKKRLTLIEHSVSEIEKLNRGANDSVREKVREKLIELSLDLEKELNLDAERFEQEVLYYLLKYDIKEELVRIRSHIKAINDYINLDKPMGKAITFILQEILREANTICSKTTDMEIKNEGLRIKIETERIREQVNNVE